MSKTYLLQSDVPTLTTGVVNLVAQQWKRSGRWMVGQRPKSGKVITFQHRSFPSLTALCASRDLDVNAVRRRAVTA